MKDTNITFYIGLFLSALVVANVALWVYVSIVGGGLSFDGARQSYLAHFPDFLQHAMLLTLLNVVLGAVSLYLLLRAGDAISRLYSLIRIPVISVNVVLIAWNIFTLM
jgi:hypothetical protein